MGENSSQKIANRNRVFHGGIMQVDGSSYRTIWTEQEQLFLLDQTRLPWELKILEIPDVATVVKAIADMWVRGAGCIGATAGYGMWLAAKEVTALALDHARSLQKLQELGETLKATRPTAVNLAWAVDRLVQVLRTQPVESWVQLALAEASAIADEDVDACERIGRHGVEMIEAISRQQSDGVVNLLTHCNAGWLAFVDHGSATAPIYEAHRRGIAVHVWVDETRPRNQGAKLTAWELEKAGIPHTVIADNTGGHLMQHGKVDMVITGADRVTRDGDVANKIGTYLKALAARDNEIPFYVAFPSSTMDWNLGDGVKGIPIEQRGSEELRWMNGLDRNGVAHEIAIFDESHPVANFGFDVTPARLISGWITEHGVHRPAQGGLKALRATLDR